MAFIPVKSDCGAVAPFEYMPAAAGEFVTGGLLQVTSGKVTALSAASTTTPAYLCVYTGTAEADQMIPVIRVSDDAIYETTLSAAASGLAIGAKLQVAKGGEQATYNSTTAGAFEVVSFEGTAAGDRVRGRFV